MKKITILLVDDHMVLRQGMRALLMTEPDLDVVGEAENGRQAVEMAAKLQPEVVVMDIAMPQLNGLEATRRIVKESPRSRVLILSSYSDDKFVQELTEAGAIGYLLKQTAAPDFIKAVREAQKGKPCFSPTISKRLFDHYRQAFLTGTNPRNAKPTATLTSREREVLQLVAEGKGNREVAAALDISVKTVEKHRQHTMDKLNIHDVAGLTRYAIAEGMIASAP
ncbi:MAG TPA: response regulator transcription factor [Opitutaceae bacterium]|nr:response regulator transcription factor [Opitutaceae bacterium]